MVLRLFLSLLLLSASAKAEVKSHKGTLAAPIFVSLEGIGSIYGGAVGVKKLFNKEGELIIGGTLGSLKAAGVLVRDVPVFGDRLSLSFGHALVDQFEFQNSYNRGFNTEGHVFIQEMSGVGNFINLNLEVLKNRLFFDFGESNSVARFENYKALSGVIIPFDKTSLHDIDTNTTSIGLKAYLFPKNDKPGTKNLLLDLKASNLKNRFAQSDTQQLDFKIKGTAPFSKRWAINYTAQVQKIKVTDESSGGSVNGDCSSNSDLEIRRQCELIESEVSTFVTQSNKVGTGTPLGGSRGLRSFREFRFRAANSSLAGLELTYKLKNKPHIELVSFYEVGYSNDEFSQLFTESKYSAGLGARLIANGLPLRLEFASGDDSSSAVFFTAGYPW